MDYAPTLRIALPADDDDSFNWLLWGGVGLAAVVIIVLIIVFAVKGKGKGGDDEETLSLQKSGGENKGLMKNGSHGVGYDDTYD